MVPMLMTLILNDIKKLLTRFQPSDVDEGRFKDSMLSLLESPEGTSRKQIIPGHFTASAFVLSPDQDSLLLIEHPTLKKLLQPGGHIEAQDMSIEAAARRELQEETGLIQLECIANLFDLDVHDIPANLKKQEDAHQHFDLRLLFRAQHEVLENREEHHAKWVHRSAIEKRVSDSSILRVLKKIET